MEWIFVSERRFDRMRAQMKPTSAYAAFQDRTFMDCIPFAVFTH
jgi:hypothetical protein